MLEAGGRADPAFDLRSGDPQLPLRVVNQPTAYYRLSTKGGTEITRAFDNRPMSSRSQALFRSITEVEHVLRQHYLQFNQQSRSSSTLNSGPEMVLENSACVAVRNSTEVGTTVRTQTTPPT